MAIRNYLKKITFLIGTQLVQIGPETTVCQCQCQCHKVLPGLYQGPNPPNPLIVTLVFPCVTDTVTVIVTVTVTVIVTGIVALFNDCSSLSKVMSIWGQIQCNLGKYIAIFGKYIIFFGGKYSDFFCKYCGLICIICSLLVYRLY